MRFSRQALLVTRWFDESHPPAECVPLRNVLSLPLMRCTADESSCPPGERETAAGAINYQPKIEPTPPLPTHFLPEQ